MQQGAFTLFLVIPSASILIVVLEFLPSVVLGQRDHKPARAVVSIQHFVNFSLVPEGPDQNSALRVVIDRLTFGISPVCCAPEHPGPGSGKWLVSCVFSHPRACRGFGRWMPATMRMPKTLYAPAMASTPSTTPHDLQESSPRTPTSPASMSALAAQ